MAERRTSLMTPRMESLLERVDSKFTLVTLSAMRAREINDYYNQLGEGLGKSIRKFRKAVNQPDEIDVTPKKDSDEPNKP